MDIRPFFFICWMLVAIQCDDEIPDVLTLEERMDIFGTNSSQNLPKFDFVRIEKLTPGDPRQFRKRPPSVLQYRVKLNNEDITLTLRPNRDLISPECVVIHYQRNRNKLLYPCAGDYSQCFYTGRSVNHNDSWVAANVCDGLRGVITIGTVKHYIAPLNQKTHPSNDTSQGYHVTYRYQSDKKVCGTNERAPEDYSLRIQYPHRVPRATPTKYIETTVVADASMNNFHGRDTEKYLHTVMNIASKLFMDSSINDTIRLVVTKVVIVEADDVFGASYGINATEDLKTFCTWQAKQNYTETADASVLITRRDLDYKGNSSAVGLANPGAVCHTSTKCAVAEDNGPDVAFVVAHEVGHLLGMNHDGDGLKEQNCTVGIMTSAGASGPSGYMWSNCSAIEMKNFFSKGHGKCLLNEPIGLTYKDDKRLPGTIYTADDQCIFLSGDQASYCHYSPTIKKYNVTQPCEKLVCRASDDSLCQINTSPLIDGTDFNNTRTWCIKGEPVAMPTESDVPRIDGGWSQWDRTFSPCSRSCGGGVKVMKRKCNSPPAQYGGKECEGSSTSAVICNIKPCPSNYRQEQCDSISNIKVKYIADTRIVGDEQSCRYQCKSKTGTYSGFVMKDGTDCLHDEYTPFSRCVTGVCRKFGCDGHMDSTFTYDNCGICNGTGNTCNKLAGKYKKDGLVKNFTHVLTIPTGSTSILVSQKNDWNYLSVLVDHERLFNKNAKGYSNAYNVLNMDIVYNSQPERIEVHGPSTTSLDIQVYQKLDPVQFVNITPEVVYEYFVPNTEIPLSSYSWSTQLQQCSSPCGTGQVTPDVRCLDMYSGLVEDYHCDIALKPSEWPQPCNDFPCPPKWETSDKWTSCSVSCGTGVKQQAVHCMRKNKGKFDKVEDNICDGLSKPTASSTCDNGPCFKVTWKTSEWSECSRSCGKGIKTRTVRCYKFDNFTSPLSDYDCSRNKINGTRPIAHVECMDGPCNLDLVGTNCTDLIDDCFGNYGRDICYGTYANWALKNCMRSCGACVSSCYDDSTSNRVVWSPSNWSQCSYSCGDGIQSRSVRCTVAGSPSRYTADQCCTGTKPLHTTRCNNGPCGTNSESVNCTNKVENCKAYGASVCTEYRDWATVNCRQQCGICATTCADNDTTICQTYKTNGFDICGTQYRTWAQTHCAKFCGFCGPACEDTIANCSVYGTAMCTNTKYSAWASKNCKKHCGFC